MIASALKMKNCTKADLDQNEKLAMYGLTEVSACDGYSGKIAAFVTLRCELEDSFPLVKGPVSYSLP